MRKTKTKRLDQWAARTTHAAGFWRAVWIRGLHDGIPRMAAAASFYALFSLIPLLLVLIAFIGLLFGPSAASGYLFSQLHMWIGEEEAAFLQRWVQNVYNPKAGLTATLISALPLTWGASMMIAEVKQGLNLIGRVEKRGMFRSFLRARMSALPVVLFIGGLVILLAMVTTSVSAVGVMINNRLPYMPFILHLVQVGASLGLLTLALAVIYHVLPDIQVRWKHAFVGASLASCLFTLGNYLLSTYLVKKMLHSTYGRIGSLLAVLIWTYFCVHTLYWGAELIAVWTEREKETPSTRS